MTFIFYDAVLSFNSWLMKNSAFIIFIPITFFSPFTITEYLAKQAKNENITMKFYLSLQGVSLNQLSR